MASGAIPGSTNGSMTQWRCFGFGRGQAGGWFFSAGRIGGDGGSAAIMEGRASPWKRCDATMPICLRCVEPELVIGGHQTCPRCPRIPFDRQQRSSRCSRWTQVSRRKARSSWRYDDGSSRPGSNAPDWSRLSISNLQIQPIRGNGTPILQRASFVPGPLARRGVSSPAARPRPGEVGGPGRKPKARRLPQD